MPANLDRSGNERAGYTQKIQEGGSSGTADTTREGVYPRKTHARSSDGAQFVGMYRRSSQHAEQGTSCVARDSGKLSCIGHTIAAPYKQSGLTILPIRPSI